MVLDGGLPPYKTGGIETYVNETATVLVGQGHDVEVFVPLPLGHESHPFRVNPVKPSGDMWAGYFSGLVSYPMTYWRLLRALRRGMRQRFDVVYAHNPFMAGRAAGKTACETGTPAMLHYHFSHSATRFLAGKGKSLGEHLAFFGISGYQRYATNNSVTKEALSQRFGVNKELIDVIPLFVDTERFNPEVAGTWVRDKYGIPADALVVVFVGRIERIKNLGLLLRAVSRVVVQEDCYLLVVGAGSLLEEMRQLSQHLSIDRRVVFVGTVPGNDLPAFYRAGDIVAYPGLDECYSLVVLEAASCARAVLGTDHPVMLEEFADGGRAATIHKRNDMNSLAGKLLELIRDKSLRDFLGRNARRKVEACHSISKHAETLLASWQRTISSAQKA